MREVVLGPFWVGLFYAERPTGTVLVSSLVVLGSVLWYLATTHQPQAGNAGATASAPSIS